MAQLPCIGLYKSCIYLPFGDCAMYFDHGVYLNMMEKLPPRPRYARAASASAPGGCRAPLKKKKLGMENGLGWKPYWKWGSCNQASHFLGVPAFFCFEKNIELLVQNWCFTPYCFLDLSGCLGGIPIVFFANMLRLWREFQHQLYTEKSSHRESKDLVVQIPGVIFLKMTKTLPTNQKKNHSSHKYTTRKVPSLKLT